MAGWQGLGVCWVGVAVSRWGGGVLCTMLGWRGGRWRLGLACCVEAAWRVGGVLACHVGSVRWVGGGGVAGQDGGGSRARMGCNLQGLVLCWGGEVLRHVGVARWVGSGGVSEQDGGGSRAQMAVLRAVLGRWVGGGSMLQAMSGRRVGAGTNGSGLRAQGDGNGLQR
ncbi:hypothetical protein EDB89DRAFT_1914121 [Lactarius sanguifluus]|nr:hypothetical protein EDB89DRAFT_1914121 [Lactarius sanguifluus]